MSVMPISNINIYSQKKTNTKFNLSSINTRPSSATFFKGALNETAEKSAPIVERLKEQLTKFIASIASDKNILDLMKTGQGQKSVKLEYEIAGLQGEKLVRKINIDSGEGLAYIKDVSAQDENNCKVAINHNPFINSTKFASITTPEGMIHATNIGMNGAKYTVRESKDLGGKVHEGNL